MSHWRVEVTMGKEIYVAQGHYDNLALLAWTPDDQTVRGTPEAESPLAAVEIQALISGPFSNTRIVSTVRLNCYQNTEALSEAQSKAIELSMDGARSGWEILQERVAKGHFPGGGQ